MASHSLYRQWTNGARTFAKTISTTGGLEVNLDETIPPSSTNLTIALTLDVSAVKSVYLLADAAMTVKTNSTSAPDKTITLAANEPVEWVTGDNTAVGDACPWGAVDVTVIYVTSSAGGQLVACNLVDPTP